MAIDFKPYDYQKQAREWIVEKPRCALFLDMGLGKTVSTLTAISELMYDRFEISKVLVIAPLRVARDTWPTEIKKWNQTKDLSVSVVVGKAKERRQALSKKADIYVINRDNVVWLLQNSKFDYDMIVIDELSSFKNQDTKRFKALKQVIQRCDRVVGLTGTPAPNGLIDLWAQMYLIDNGDRLFKTLTKYRLSYFRPGAHKGHTVFNYKPLTGAEEIIYKKLSDICLAMKKEDYLSLPEKIFIDIEVEMEGDDLILYRDFEEKAVLKFYEDEEAKKEAEEKRRRRAEERKKKGSSNQFEDEIEDEEEEDGVTKVIGNTKAALAGKLSQIANGAVYDEDKVVHRVHDKKLDALEELIESAVGEPVLVFYAYQHDKDRIMERFPQAQKIETSEDVEKWNRGEIPMAISHPASIGHGLNLQFGGHIIIWFGLTWSLELYQQANDRLHRNGQEKPVMIYHILTKGTVDHRILSVVNGKASGQDVLMEYLKAKEEEEDGNMG